MNEAMRFLLLEIIMTEETEYVIDAETLDRLIHIIENEKFYRMPRMPSGLTREERRSWAKSNINNEENKNDLRIDN